MMNDIELSGELLKLADEFVSADTFKCPDCGTKVMEQTGYCVKCKKKVKKGSVRQAAQGRLSESDDVLLPIVHYYLNKFVGSDVWEIEEVRLVSAGVQFGLSVTYWDQDDDSRNRLLIDWGKPKVKVL